MRTLRVVTLGRCLLTQCARDSGPPPEVLLFAGTGTSPNDVAALTALLDARHIRYASASSRQLNEATPASLRGYTLLIVPGGNFEQMGRSLTPGTATRIRAAVDSGLNYLGICAGAFLAGRGPYNGFDLTGGTSFGFYAAEREGIRKVVLPISVGGAPSFMSYWEDGPVLSGWGESVAGYPDGTPAVVQGEVGTGWVVLLGIHPEAPAGWYRAIQSAESPAGANAFAAAVIESALHRRPLPAHHSPAP